MASPELQTKSPVLHVVVIGFHHKKGSQVEYSYPPLIPGGEVHSNEVPTEWKNLPSLAVPDGAHNYTKDTIFFHLPAREGTYRTVYGVACYRQIDSNNLKNRTTDITRSTVQKSVCVLSYLPLYGLIQAKLELITHAYFKELDFSQVSLLEETYKNLTLSLTDSLLDGGSQVYLGMSVKDLVLEFKHKIIQIFKLILLERRVLFTGSPVEVLGNTLLAVLSLFPGMIEHGLIECTTYGVHKKVSPTMKNTLIGEENEEYLEIRYSGSLSPEVKLQSLESQMDSLEPESPTIERGDRMEYPRNVQYSSDKTKLLRLSSLDSQLRGDLHYVDDYYADKPGVHGSAKRRTKSVEIDDRRYSRENLPGSDDRNQQILLEDSSLKMMGSMQYEAVQAGKCIPNNDSVINIEEFSQSIEIDEDHFANVSERATIGSAPGELSVSLEDYSETDTKEIHPADSVEELDSPESINQIDREDCFSWEDDKLSLAIDTDKSPNRLDDTAGLASSFKDVVPLEKGVKSASQNNDGDSVEKKGRESVGSGTTTVKEGSSDAGKGSSRESSPGSTGSTPGMKASAIKSRLTTAFSGLSIKQRLRNKTGSRENSEPPSPAKEQVDPPALPVIHQDDLGLPLAVFTKGCVCFPYLSLQYFDLLNDVNVRSFVIGATNMLFRQKRHLTDVIIDVNESKLEIHDRELAKQLVLTTADLRFADIMVKAVMGSTDDAYLEGTEWEGNDEWLRAQFRMYLESLLATSLTEDGKLLDDYGSLFIQTWKTTHNYRVWSSTAHPGIKRIQVGHPCQGHLGVGDIKVRLSHTMQSTEGGKKINAAVTQTGKYVVQTGKVVGGALTSAKSSLSSWFTSLTSDWKSTEKGDQAKHTDADKTKATQPTQKSEEEALEKNITDVTEGKK